MLGTLILKSSGVSERQRAKQISGMSRTPHIRLLPIHAMCRQDQNHPRGPPLPHLMGADSVGNKRPAQITCEGQEGGVGEVSLGAWQVSHPTQKTDSTGGQKSSLNIRAILH